ncbi:MAG: helix-turn-helix transcriptional regulator [Candidatus Omnitrophica bacterium]|nr:helix-turn-helix transcriptional regulator [Candidatus Omnitrophota bacterium]
MRTRITDMAHARGLTAAAVARRLRLYPSNLSAMDAGRRAISLKALARVARMLDCSPGDLLGCSEEPTGLLYRQPRIRERLCLREGAAPDGAERGWVHRVLLAWQRHYRAPRARRDG